MGMLEDANINWLHAHENGSEHLNGYFLGQRDAINEILNMLY